MTIDKVCPSSRRTLRIKYVGTYCPLSLSLARPHAHLPASSAPFFLLSFLFTLDVYLLRIFPPRVYLCVQVHLTVVHTSATDGMHAGVHTRVRRRAEEPLMNLAVLRPPVCVPGIAVREENRHGDGYTDPGGFDPLHEIGRRETRERAYPLRSFERSRIPSGEQ